MTARLVHGILILATMVAASPAFSGEQPCLNELRASINVDPLLVTRISAENEISILLAEDAHFLRDGIRKPVERGSDPLWPHCLKLADQVLLGLDRFFTARLSILLERGEVERFYTELQNLLAPIHSESEKWSVYRLFEPLKQRYIDAIHANLLRDLGQDPRWRHYAGISARVGIWSEEWQQLLGRTAPAAVDLTNATIALRPFGSARDREDSPEVLRIFLFHELAHLVGQRNFNLTDRHANEVFAWGETIEYLKGLQNSGKEIPDIFQRTASTIRLVGLEKWVTLVILSQVPVAGR